MDAKEKIARRVAKELKDGDCVNLGIGIPTMVADYLPEGVNIVLQSENGFLGVGPAPQPGMEEKNLANAGGLPITLLPGAACFDSATSFGIIRGGHVSATVLGALEVDQEGNLANWIIPGKKVPGMGGAMDLVVGAEKVIIAMEHTAKGQPKILKKCTLPLTAQKEVNIIVTELAVMKITDKGLKLVEISSETNLQELQNLTEATLLVEDDLKIMEI